MELNNISCLWSTRCSKHKSRAILQKASETVSEKFNIELEGTFLKTIIHGLKTSLISEMKKEQEGKLKVKVVVLRSTSYMNDDIDRFFAGDKKRTASLFNWFCSNVVGIVVRFCCSYQRNVRLVESSAKFRSGTKISIRCDYLDELLLE